MGVRGEGFKLIPNLWVERSFWGGGCASAVTQMYFNGLFYFAIHHFIQHLPKLNQRDRVALQFAFAVNIGPARMRKPPRPRCSVKLPQAPFAEINRPGGGCSVQLPHARVAKRNRRDDVALSNCRTNARFVDLRLPSNALALL